MAIVIALAIALWIYRKKISGELWTALALMVAPLLPVLNLRVFHFEYIVQDRYLYLPSIGFCYLLAILIVRLARRRAQLSAVLAALGTGVMLILSVYLMQSSLLREIRETASPKLPNMFIIDVTSVDPSQVAVISGPNLASEITAGQPAATVIACSDSGRAVALQRMLNAGYFRPYTNADVIGTEIGGACKNVIALACGMAAGVGLGENTAAAIITRGLAEIMRLGIAVGAKAATLAGLAGVGDLVATCTSSQSRNRSFGESLGRGKTMEAALRARDGHVVEGVTSCESVLALASSYDVEMPLTDAVHRVCHKGLSVDQAVALLLGRSTKPE